MPGYTPNEHRLILDDIGVIIHHWHSRWRVYPRDVTIGITLTAGTPANTFGSWAEIIPLNTIPFLFHVIGFCVCDVSVATNYHIQIGYNIKDANPGVNMEMGERRFRIATVPIARQSEIMEIYSQEVPANSKVMGRMKTATGNLDTANMNAVITRHIEVTREVSLYPAFPW